MDRGIRIGNEMLTWIRADEQIRPLRDQIVIEPLPLDLNTSLNVIYRGKPVRGIVRAAGPGCYPKKYDGPRGKRKKVWDSNHFRPCDVKVGDVVDIGGLDIGGYLFPLLRWGDMDVMLCREEDVAIVCEQVKDERPKTPEEWQAKYGYWPQGLLSQKQCPPTTTHEG